MTFFKNVETNELDCLPITELTILKDSGGKKYFLTPDQADNYFICDCCGALINKEEDEDWQSDGDITVCSSCYDNNYTYCDDCGKLIYSDNCIWIKDTEIGVCESCANANYYRCSDCGNWYCSATQIYNDDYICENCIDEYYYCEGCGEYYPADMMDGDYCIDCSPSNVIYSHSYKSNLYFYEEDNDPNPDLFFGIELEVSGDKEHAENFLNIVNKQNDYIYLKNDSSIVNEGFEIVTHPMTFDFLNITFKSQLENGLKFLKDNDFQGHNMGGMHVHISRGALTPQQLAIIANIIYIEVCASNDKLLTISQRSASNLKSWADNKLVNKSSLIYNILTDINYRGDTRYTAINFRNTDTIEFRIFNSNLRIERIFKNIEFIQALIDYSRQFKSLPHSEILDSLYRYNYNSLFDFITKNNSKYPNLYTFLIEKELINTNIQQLPLITAA